MRGVGGRVLLSGLLGMSVLVAPRAPAAHAAAGPTLMVQTNGARFVGAGQGATFFGQVLVSPKSTSRELEPVTVTDHLPPEVSLDGPLRSAGWNCAPTQGSDVSCTATPPKGGWAAGASLAPLFIPTLVGYVPLGTRFTNTITATSPDATAPAHASSVAAVKAADGYLVAASDVHLPGTNSVLLPFGAEGQFGSLSDVQLVGSMVGVVPLPDGRGDWLVAADGGVFTFGSAVFHGSLGATHIAAPVVGMAASAGDRGYWLAGADGGVFAFGAARYLGGLAGIHLAAPIVGIAAAPDGAGYWLVGADGGVFAFGSARFFGGLGSVHLAAPIVGVASSHLDGYWLVGADGGVFAFGAARYLGGEAGQSLPAQISAIGACPDGLGYWLLGLDGSVYNMGAAPFYGSAAGPQLGGFAAVAIAP